MKTNEAFMTDTVMATLAIYAEMRRRTTQDQIAAEQELRNYVPKLIAEGETNRENLMVKALIHLRRCDDRPRPIPAWMRRRAADAAASADSR